MTESLPGPLLKTDVLGELARSFDGVDDYVTIAENAASNLGGRSAFTIAAWIYPRSAVQQFPVIYAEGHWRVSLGLKSGTTKLDSWVNNTVQITSTGDLQFNQWQHVALVVNGGERRFYINGLFAGSGSNPAVEADTTGAAIGGTISEPTDGRNRFDGSIDEVTLWDVALDEARLLNLANAPVAGGETGLIAWWPLNESGGTTFADGTGGGSDGISGGGVASRMPRRVLNTAAPYLAFLPRLTDASHRVIYAPDENLAGFDSLRYRVNDGKVDSNEGVVNLRILPVNDAPVAVGESAFALQGLPQFIGNVLTNDFDVEGTPISVLDFTQAANGSVSSNAPGIFVYTSNPGFIGEDFFTYRITDGTTNSAPATVNITVTALDEFRWVNAAGGNWDTASNWSQNRVPGPADNVIINLDGDYTVTLDASASVNRLVIGGGAGAPVFNVNGRTLTVANDSFLRPGARLNHPGGTLSIAGRLTVEGTFNWSGGFLTGAGTTDLLPGAVVTFNGGDKFINDGHRLLNRSTMDLTIGRLFIGNQSVAGARFENVGTLNISGEADLEWWNFSGARPVSFVNSGTINKAGAGTITEINVPFTNEGVLNVNAGTVQKSNPLVNRGTINLAAGTELNLQTGNHLFEPGSTLTGAGAVRTSGTPTVAAPWTMTGRVTVSSGTMSMTTAQTWASLTISGGTLSSISTLTLTNEFVWSGGFLTGAGTTDLLPGAVVTFNGGDKFINDGHRLLNRSTMDLTIGRLFIGNQSVAGARFENVGTLNISGEADLEWWNFSGARPVSFVNGGIMNKAGVGTITEINVPWSNSGVVNLNEGSLLVTQGITQSGTVVLASGATLRINGGTSTVSDTTLFAGDGTINFENGTLLTSADAVIGTAVNFQAGTWGGTNLLTISRSLNWTGGAMDGAGITEIAAGAVASLVGGDKRLRNGHRLLNRGTITMSAGRLFLSNPNTAGATLDNLGTLNFEGEADLIWENFSSTRPVSFINRSTMTKTGAGTLLEITVPWINEGALNLVAGTIRATEGLNHSGALQLDGGTLLRINGAVSTFSAASTTTGTGTAQLQSGTLNIGEEVTISAPFEQLAGDVDGVGRLILSGGFNWTGGNMNGAGTTEIVTGTTATLAGGDKRLRNGRTLLNRGTITMSAGRLFLSNPSIAGAKLDNEGILNLEGEADIAWENFSATRPVSFVNRGTLNKSAGGTSDILVAFTNTAAIVVTEGTLGVRENSSLNGSVNIESAGGFNLFAGNHIFEVGLVWSGSGTLTIARPVTLREPVNFGDLIVHFNSGATVSGAFAISNTVDGELHVNQTMTFPGDLSIGGLLKIANAAHTVTIVGTLTLANTGTIDNAGTLRAGAFTDQSGTIIGNPPVVIGLAPIGVVSFQSIQLAGGAKLQTEGGGAREVVLVWEAASPVGYEVEMSYDLKTWLPLGAQPRSNGFGTWTTRAVVSSSEACFFRIRWVGGSMVYEK